jgi:hemerythrin-like domain-containing protein
MHFFTSFFRRANAICARRVLQEEAMHRCRSRPGKARVPARRESARRWRTSTQAVSLSGVTNRVDSLGGFLALLVEDHARMETRLAALVQSLDSVRNGGDVDAHFALAAATLDFFESEGAVHESLEENLLFPRLGRLPQFKQVLSALEFQHRMNRTEGEQLRACVDRRATGPELRRAAVRFIEMHRGHVVAEERALFPLVSSTLTPQELEALDAEARKRLQASKEKSR